MSRTDIQARVERLSKVMGGTLTERDIYLSPEFAQYMQNLTDTITGRYLSQIVIKQYHSIRKEMAACTNGDIIEINTENTISGHFSTMLNRFLTNIGILFHEVAHIMYLDFPGERAAINCIQGGKMYGKEPSPSLELQELIEAMKKPNMSPVFAKLYANLSNIISDPHDEDLLIAQFGGYVSKCIMMVREGIRGTCRSLESILEENNRQPLATILSLVFQYARFENVIYGDEAALNTEPMQMLTSIAPAIDGARRTNNTIEKYTYLNEIILALWPYIKAVAQNTDADKNQPADNGQLGDSDQTGDAVKSGGDDQLEETDQSKGSSQSEDAGQRGDGDQTGSAGQSSGRNQIGNIDEIGEADLTEMLKQLETACKNSGATVRPERGLPPISSSNTVPTSERNAEQEARSEVFQAAMDQLLRQIADRMAEEGVEQELMRETLRLIDDVSISSSHKGMRVFVKTQPYSGKHEMMYGNLIGEVKPYSKTLQKKIRDELRDLQEGEQRRHLSFGASIEVKSAYRPDQKFFANKKRPKERPELAISVLVDQSGSMRGPRIHEARRAAVLLYDFATGLQIPIAIAGHNTADAEGINYYPYINFGEYSRRKGVGITAMDAESAANRDGMAIEIAANLLSRRSEDNRILIIISDGQPSHLGYCGEAARKDIQEVIRRYKRQGIETIAAAIGDDKDLIKAIYGSGYIDISDISRLPNILAGIVKKRILR